MMAKFQGDLLALQVVLAENNLDGHWAEISGGHKFSTPDGAILTFFNTKTLLSQGKGISKNKIDQLIKKLESGEVDPSSVTKEVAVAVQQLFVVYGHDEISRDQLELVLSKLEIQSFILAKSSGDGMTIIEALEKHVGQKGTAKAGIVLLTPDDMGYAKNEGERAIKERARQNVILEMGMLISKLGRQNTIILVKGKLERPSDTDGIIYHSFNTHIKEVVAALAERLEGAGFVINHKKALEFVR